MHTFTHHTNIHNEKHDVETWETPSGRVGLDGKLLYTRKRNFWAYWTEKSWDTQLWMQI